MPAEWRKRQGCDGPGTTPVALLPDGSPLHECPGRALDAATVRAVSWFGLWDKGRAIGAPCAADESATLVAALRIVGSEVATWQSEELNRGR